MKNGIKTAATLAIGALMGGALTGVAQSRFEVDRGPCAVTGAQIQERLHTGLLDVSTSIDRLDNEVADLRHEVRALRNAEKPAR